MKRTFLVTLTLLLCSLFTESFAATTTSANMQQNQYIQGFRPKYKAYYKRPRQTKAQGLLRMAKMRLFMQRYRHTTHTKRKSLRYKKAFNRVNRTNYKV